MVAGQGGTEYSVNTCTYTRMHRLKTKSYSIIVKSQKIIIIIKPTLQDVLTIGR